MKKIGKVLGCIWPLICAFLIQIMAVLVGSWVGGLVVGAMAAAKGFTEAEMKEYIMEVSTSADFLMALTIFATLGTLVMGIVWYRKHKPASELGLKQVVNGKLLAATAVLGISLQCLVSLCLNMVYPLLPQSLSEEYSALMETLMGGNALLSLIATVILAPLAEEFIFRGIIQKKAENIMPLLWANVLQALLFGIYHGNLIQGAYAFVLGLVLGFTAKYFHSIWASILLHAFVNASAELLSRLPEEIMGTWAGVIGIAVIGVVLLILSVKLYPGAKTEPVTEAQGLHNSKESDLEII